MLSRFQMHMITISELFEAEPAQWGLRGDPHLWEDMKAKLKTLIMPATGLELERILESVFMELTTRNLDNRDPIYIARYDQGGMSSGMVCPDFWRRKAVPIILSRYDATMAGD